MSVKPLLVASGTLRIDRDAALRKLKDYQVADPWTCLLEFVRCAHRCEADVVQIDLLQKRALRIRFDGVSFGWSRLLDPFQALLRPGATDAGRLLAVGLLGAIRVSGRVSVTSGRPPWRWRSRIRSLHDIRVDQAGGSGTIVDLLDVSPPRDWREPLIERCQMARCSVVLQGEEAPQGIGGSAFGRDFRTRVHRGRVEWASPFRRGTIEIYTRGVLAETVSLMRDTSMRAWVNDDGLTFDASRSKLVRNRRFQGLLNAVEHGTRAVHDDEKWRR